MIVRDAPAKITTVLGSCIAMSLFVPKLKAGAICHALLPVCREQRTCRERCINPYKYVNCVIPEMIRRLEEMGAGPREMEAKLFGGADMFSNNSKNGAMSVGRQNIQAAIQTVAACGVKLKLSDVGLDHGRKLHFFPHTGDVWMKRLGNKQNKKKTTLLTALKNHEWTSININQDNIGVYSRSLAVKKTHECSINR